LGVSERSKFNLSVLVNLRNRGKYPMGIKVLPALVGGVLGLTSMVSPVYALSQHEMDASLYVVESNKSIKTVVVGGKIIPHKTVTLTAQIPGRVLNLAGEEGDKFKKGVVLVELSEDSLKAKLNEAISQRDTATSKVRSAEAQYYRHLSGDNQNMMTQGTPMSWMGNVMPQKKGDSYYADASNARSGVDMAKTGVAAANSMIKAIQTKFRDAKSLAPMDGQIIKKHVEEGNPVQPGMKLLDFADTSILQIQIEVPVQQIEGLHEDMLIEAEIDKRIKTQARVAKIFPMASAQHTFTVKLDLPANVNDGVAPGMYTEVYLADISKTVQNLPMVPKTAIKSGRSIPQVYVIVNNRPVLRALRVEKNAIKGDMLLVLSGLRVGERVLRVADERFVNRWVETVNQ
jgi:multidrug efflux pump subunit AcrA (membrane-fusion protein)